MPAAFNFRSAFHALSFAQYPLMVIAIIYIGRPFFRDFAALWADFNLGLLFFGLAISFGSLQDITRPHYSMAKRIFETPAKAKALILLLVVEIVFFIAMGLFGLLGSHVEELREVSFGLIIFGLGMLGMLKTALESADYHQRTRKDEPLQEP